MKDAIRWFTIMIFCITLGFAIGHPMGWAIMAFGNDNDRNIYRGQTNFGLDYK